MKYVKENKFIRVILIVILVCMMGFAVFGAVAYFNTQKNEISESDFKLEPYSDHENLFFLSEDYIVDGKVALQAGYYEAVHVIQGTEQCIFIPIDPKTLERLPSEQFEDGTTMEFSGKMYEIHVQGNEYTAMPMEEK